MYKLLFPALILQSLSLLPVIADNQWDSSSKGNNKLDRAFYNSQYTSYPYQANIKWKRVLEKNIDEKKINWGFSDFNINEINTTEPKSFKEKINSIKDREYVDKLNLKALYIGNAVPTANTLNKGDLEISVTQVAPIEGAYYGGGTGNQNYVALFNYGLKENITISGFFSHSDDPLHVRIPSLEKQPSNLWVSYGTSFTWNKSLNKDLRIALNASIENWLVKSGGCNLYRCTYKSNNIFNSSLNEVEKNNLVGSVSLPITWNASKQFELTFSPRAIFLPDSQGNNDGSGSFYGNSIGIGTGLEYKPTPRFKLFSSAFLPFGPGYNVFNSNLKFSRKNIYATGISVSVDPKTAIEASVTNSFGLSPSTGILAIPSSNQMLYALKLTYRPTNHYWSKNQSQENDKKKFNGLSVSIADFIYEGQKKIQTSFDNKGSWLSRVDWGLSDSFTVDLSFTSIGQGSHEPNSLDSDYHKIDEYFYRGGGKIKLYENDTESITSAFRVSAGRVMGTGWIFGELLNTYAINERIKFNLNPKISLSGNGNPSAIGTSIHWELIPGLSLIPETNIAIAESQNNWTLAVRFSPVQKHFLDLYTTNSLNFLDTGQVLKAKDQSFGINFGTIF